MSGEVSNIIIQFNLDDKNSLFFVIFMNLCPMKIFPAVHLNIVTQRDDVGILFRWFIIKTVTQFVGSAFEH